MTRTLYNSHGLFVAMDLQLNGCDFSYGMYLNWCASDARCTCQEAFSPGPSLRQRATTDHFIIEAKSENEMFLVLKEDHHQGTA